ncbi:MAG: DUF3868 domain-containing protein [Bacteroidales bacterium]|nr:DUF3868 domain-containing protein [Bacteroidales bacterium]
MKKTFSTISFALAAMTALSVSANAASLTEMQDYRTVADQNINGASSVLIEDVVVSNPVIIHSGDFIKVEMDIDLTGLKVRQNRAVLLTPHIVSETDSLDLTSVGIYGRRRHFYYERMGNGSITEGEISYRLRRNTRKPDHLEYSQVVDYLDAVGDGKLALHFRRGLYGCCGRLKDEVDAVVFVEPEAFYPELVYIVPPANVMKERSLSGSANIEYMVNKTDIRPDYRDNVAELKKITGMVDVTLGDSDVTITKLYLKGYASPEGNYAHNSDLAKGRVASLRDYVQDKYQFEPGLIQTDYEPEDWDGLRKFVEETNMLSHRDEILELIDSDMEIDAKERRIHTAYPEDYDYLLKTCYPALRHTYYEVSYTIREFKEVDEIREVYQTAPDKLNLPELYVLADTYEPGSEEFEAIFDLTVQLYPDDPASALNAANAAIRSFNFQRARYYLEKAGDSPKAEYARGVCDYWEGHYQTALEHFTNAKNGGVEQADEVIEVIQGNNWGVLDTARRNAIRKAEYKISNED